MDNLRLQLDEFLGLADIFDTKDRMIKLNNLVGTVGNLTDEERSLTDVVYTKLLDLYSADYIDNTLEDEVLNDLYKKHPIYNIQTAHSLDCAELKSFVHRLSEKTTFDAHLSVKLKGWSVRLIYEKGQFTKALNKLGKDITEVVRVILEDKNCLIIEDFESIDIVEVRGTLIIPKSNLVKVKEIGKPYLTNYTGITYLCSTDNSNNEWYLMDILAFDIISSYDLVFSSKTDIFQYLEELGFDVPLYWNLESLSRETILEDLEGIVNDCEMEVRATDVQEGYNYETDGLIFTVDDMNYFNYLGKSQQKYLYGNINLKIGYWQQTLYSGYIQTILWKSVKNKLQPYAVIADEKNKIEFDDLGDYPYIFNYDNVVNKRNLGVEINDKKVLEIPLFNPSVILRLDAYVGTKLLFVDNSILGLLPCFEDGRVLLDGYIKNSLDGEYSYEQ